MLEENSTKFHYIEYRDDMSNHLAHGMVALAELGASQYRIMQYMDEYMKKLEKPEKYAEENNPELPFDPEAMKGKRKCFYRLLDHYEAKEGALDEVVGAALPGLAAGFAGAAFHGLIQLGYGYHAGSHRVVYEGLAYAHHSYLPVLISDEESLFKPLGVDGNTEPVQVLNNIRADKSLTEYMIAERVKYSNVGEGRYVKGVRVVNAGKGNELMKYVNSMKTPQLMADHSAEQLSSFLNWLLNTIITIYTATENNGARNDFFLLHGVTAAWSLRQVLHCVQEGKERLRILRLFLCSVMTVYVLQFTPLVSTDHLDSGLPAASLTWKAIVDDALEKERDEHVYKLIQICKELDGMPENKEMSPIYKIASDLIVKKPYFLRGMASNGDIKDTSSHNLVK